MRKPDFDPSRIRKCELIENNKQQFVQFLAIGDRHKMMRTDDGTVEIIKLEEEGNEYRYGEPVKLDVAIDILEQGAYHTHKDIAAQIKDYMNSL